MFEEDKTRFIGAEEALRFYFRVRELLHCGGRSRLAADELPADACLAAANAIDDYQCIGWCMHGLDDTALWLLTEVYRRRDSACIGKHSRKCAGRQAGVPGGSSMRAKFGWSTNSARRGETRVAPAGIDSHSPAAADGTAPTRSNGGQGRAASSEPGGKPRITRAGAGRRKGRAIPRASKFLYA